MIVSMQMAVLPVLRSPMISSPLSAADGRHRVDGLDAGLQRLLDGLAAGDAGSGGFQQAALIGQQRSAAVQRIAQRVEHAAQHRFAHRHAQQPAGAADLVPLADAQVVAQHDDPDRVLFEVEGQAEDVAGKLDHLAGHHAGQAVNLGDAVADLDDAADLPDIDAGLVLLNFLLD